MLQLGVYKLDVWLKMANKCAYRLGLNNYYHDIIGLLWIYDIPVDFIIFVRLLKLYLEV